MCSLVPVLAAQDRTTMTRNSHDKIWISGDLFVSVTSSLCDAIVRPFRGKKAGYGAEQGSCHFHDGNKSV
jgi:hypothetical protein